MHSIKEFSFQFLIGLSDSLSVQWVPRILFALNPSTGKPHPRTHDLKSTFKNAFMQVVVLLLIVPGLLDYVGLDITAAIVAGVMLLLSYGYIFFYNMEVMEATADISRYAIKYYKEWFCEFDVREKMNRTYRVANMVKGIIFLVLYYVPLNLVLTLFSLYFPIAGSVLLVLSQSFFNATFYYLQKWPYDQYNIAFIERHAGYMIGFGFSVSLVCNVFLGGIRSIACFMLVSLWMMINCQLYSPPPAGHFRSFREVFKAMADIKERSKVPNAFNQHRIRLRADKGYRGDLKNGMVVVRPAMKITGLLNSLIQARFNVSTKQATQPHNAEKGLTESETQPETENMPHRVGLRGAEDAWPQDDPSWQQLTEINPQE